MTGQHTGREARTQATADWLNAIPVGDSNGVESGVNAVAVEHEVSTIRSLMECHVDNIECFVSDPVMVAAIREQLTPEEQASVNFLGL